MMISMMLAVVFITIHECFPINEVILIALSTTIMCFLFWPLYYLEKIRIDERINLLKLSIDTEKSLEKENNIYSQSIKMNYRYLDRYYMQTQDQANKGFMVTVVVAVFGAILIFFGVISMYFGATKPAYITVASGSITEIISSVFFYLYNKTVTNMGKYHEKLVLSQNVAYALEIVDTLSEAEKDGGKKQIMLELVKDINVHLHDGENR